MEAIKKLEIIVSTVHTKKVIQLLVDHEIEGYTIIKNVQGLGIHGIQDGEGLHDVFNNDLIIVAVDQQKTQELVEPLRAFIKRSGGTCLVSDAMWIKH